MQDQEKSKEQLIEELRVANEDWNRIFDAISDLVFVMDKDNNIIKVNKSFAQALKARPEDLIGRKCYELMHKMVKPWPECPVEKTKIDKQSHIQEVDDPNIGMCLLVTSSPIFDNRGEMSGVVHIAKDITAYRKTESELNKKIIDLERFQRVTVGRELKMKELKARIAQLERELSQK